MLAEIHISAIPFSLKNKCSIVKGVEERLRRSYKTKEKNEVAIRENKRNKILL